MKIQTCIFLKSNPRDIKVATVHKIKADSTNRLQLNSRLTGTPGGRGGEGSALLRVLDELNLISTHSCDLIFSVAFQAVNCQV